MQLATERRRFSQLKRLLFQLFSLNREAVTAGLVSGAGRAFFLRLVGVECRPKAAGWVGVSF